MGLLNDTVLDALRPLPTTGSWLRRSIDPGAHEAMEEPMEESGALTIYRLQKDGGGSLPWMPSDPRAGDAGMQPHGPLSTPALIPGVHDASPRVDILKSGLETGEGQEGTTRVEARDRQERYAIAAPTEPSVDVGSSVSSIESSRAPIANGRGSTPVERYDGYNNTSWETGRGIPSGAPDIGQPAALAHLTSEAAHPYAAASAGHSKPDNPGEVTGMLPVSPNLSTQDDTNVFTPGHPLSVADLEEVPPLQGDVRVEEAVTPGRIAQGAATSTVPGSTMRLPPLPPLGGGGPPQAPPARATESQPPAETAPRLRIGQIEVVVVAQDKPGPKSGASRDDSFLSRNYLRRL